MARDRRLSRITPPRGSVPHTQRSTSQNATQSHPTEGEATENAPTEVHAILSQKPRRKKKERREGYYGPPPNCPIGKMFQTRMECSEAGVHAPSVAGISFSTDAKKRDANPGAYSIVLNGGYEDDRDAGYVIYYTGAGGQTNAYSESGEQVEDQSFQQPSNNALRLNYASKNPVRVVRGYKNPTEWAPREGYRYDGLYRVRRWGVVPGKSGHKICMFKLVRLRDQKALEDLPRYF